MKGLPVMVAVSLLVGALSAGVLGWIGGVIVAPVVFIAWFRFNMQASTTGLFKANLKSYFAFRQTGLSVDEALRAMVTARYSFAYQQEKKELALQRVAQIPQTGREKLRVAQAVINVFMVENGLPPADLVIPYKHEIDRLYDEISARYEVHQE